MCDIEQKKLEKLQLEIDELRSKKKWRIALLSAVIPLVVAILTLSTVLWDRGKQLKINALEDVKSAYDREQKLEAALNTIAASRATIECMSLNGRVVYKVSFNRIAGLESIVGGPEKGGAIETPIKVSTDVILAIASISPLYSLNLANTTVTDDHLAIVAKVTGLEELWLDETEITDAGLAHLPQASGLRLLSLSNTFVSNSGLAHLVSLSNLQELSLKNTYVNDDDRSYTWLSKMRNLSYLVLSYHDDGRLKSEIPECEVIEYRYHFAGPLRMHDFDNEPVDMENDLPIVDEEEAPPIPETRSSDK